MSEEARTATETATEPAKALRNSASSIPALLHDDEDDEQQPVMAAYSNTGIGMGEQQQPPTIADAEATEHDGTMYKYRDFGHVEEDGEDASTDEVSGPNATNRSGSESSIRVQKFPVKLYAILAQTEFHDIICWMPHGRSWKVLKPSMFESLVMPLFFEYSNYHSFNRLVNAWSFRRISSGPDRGSYYHELFLRGKPHLQKYMRRLPKTHKKLPMKKKDEPDFYKLDLANPLPEVHEAPIPGAAATVQAMRASGNPTTPPSAVLSPMSHQGGSISTAVTPDLSPHHANNFIGGHYNSNSMMGGHGNSSSSSNNNMNYMGSPGNNMNGMNFMNSSMNGSGMMPNGGFNPQGMGMMGGVSNNNNMGNMMGGMSNSGMGGNMGGGMPMAGRSDGGVMNGNGSMSNSRFNAYNDMGGHPDEFDTMPFMVGQHQSFPMNQMNGNNGGGFGNGGYGGGQSSYNNNNSIPTSPNPANLRRTMPPMRQSQQGVDNAQSSERTPQHQQRTMPSDMFQAYSQQPMSPSDMMQQHGMYSRGSGSPGDDFESASPNGMQQQQPTPQQERRQSPPSMKSDE